MKKKISILASLVIAGSSMAALANAVFTVNGQKVEKAVAHLTFDGDNVNLNYADQTSESHDLEALAIKFDDSLTAVGSLNFSKLSVTVGSTLEINGIEPGTQLSVYDVNGRMIASQVAADSYEVIDLSAAPAGVYILRAGNEIVKFVKR